MGRVALLGGFYRGDFFTVANEWEVGLVRGGCPPAICPPSLGFYSTGRVRWGGVGQGRREESFIFSFCKEGERLVVAPTEVPSDPGADVRSLSLRVAFFWVPDLNRPAWSWGVRGAGCTYTLGE